MLPAGFIPDAQPGAPNAGGLPPGFVPDAPPAATPAAPGALEAVGRGALQGATLGFGDEISGALESIFGQKTYEQARDEARAANAAAQGAHPYLYGGGELAGGLAGAVVPGMALAKAGAAAGGAVGAGLKVLGTGVDMLGGAAPEGAGLARVAAQGAAGGALAGLGGSEAKDAAGTLKDVGAGALTGGALAGGLHALGGAVKPGERFERDLNADVYGRARPKDQLTAIRTQEANPEAFREMVYSDKFRPVQEAARAGRTEEALQAADAFVQDVGKDRLANYETASGGAPTVKVGDVVSRFEREASAAGATEGRAGEGKVLRNMADTLKENWATVSRDTLTEGRLAPARREALEAIQEHLPDHPELTKRDLWEAAQKATGAKTAGDVPHDYAQAIEGLPFTYDPSAKVSLLRMRQATTAAQQHAKETLGSIAETEHHRIATAAESVTKDALRTSLDQAAAGGPDAARAVEAIRHNDKLISMGLSAKQALAKRLEKEKLGRPTLGAQIEKSVGGGVRAFGLGSLLHGDVLQGAAELAAPHVLKAAAIGARRANDQLARLVYAAEVTKNPWAMRQVAAMAAVPGGLARMAAARLASGTGAAQPAAPAYQAPPPAAAPAPASPVAEEDDDAS